MQVRTGRDRTAPPSRDGTTGVAGPKKRSSKSGKAIFIANKFPGKFFSFSSFSAEQGGQIGAHDLANPDVLHVPHIGTVDLISRSANRIVD